MGVSFDLLDWCVAWPGTCRHSPSCSECSFQVFSLGFVWAKMSEEHASHRCIAAAAAELSERLAQTCRHCPEPSPYRLVGPGFLGRVPPQLSSAVPAAPFSCVILRVFCLAHDLLRLDPLCLGWGGERVRGVATFNVCAEVRQRIRRRAAHRPLCHPEAFLFLAGRLAFAPVKNGRMGLDSDAQKMAAFVGGSCPRSRTRNGPSTSSWTPPPPLHRRVAVNRRGGGGGLRLWVSGDGFVKFPPALFDLPLSAVALARPLINCFNHDSGEPSSKFFQNMFNVKGINELERQVVWGISIALEAQLGVACVPQVGLPKSESQATLRFVEARQGIAADLSRDVRLVNYWMTGQQESRRHLGVPWSCSFDGTRVGGHSVLATCFVFPSNRAFWAPIQELMG